jgi:hypothetical protein
VEERLKERFIDAFKVFHLRSRSTGSRETVENCFFVFVVVVQRQLPTRLIERSLIIERAT